MQTGELTLEYELSLAEYTEFVRYDTYNSQYLRSYYKRQSIWYGPVLGTLLAIGFSFPRFELGLISLVIVLASISAPAFLYLDFRWGLPRRVLKSQLQCGNIGAMEPTRLTFDDNFISSEQKGIGRSQIDWSTLKRVVYTDSCYLLYISATLAIIIPMRAIGSEDDMVAFDSMIERHMLASCKSSS
jgi:hypothetical protein